MQTCLWSTSSFSVVVWIFLTIVSLCQPSFDFLSTSNTDFDFSARLGSEIIARPRNVGGAMIGVRFGFLSPWSEDERFAVMWTVTVLLR